MSSGWRMRPFSERTLPSLMTCVTASVIVLSACLTASVILGKMSLTSPRKMPTSALTNLVTFESRSARIMISSSVRSGLARLAPPAMRRMPLIARSPQS